MPGLPIIRRMTRLFGFVSILAVLAVSGYAFLGNTSVGGLSPIGKVSDAESRAEVASAKYTLAIVARQLAQVHAVTATYADTLDFDNPFVRLIRADENVVLRRVQEDGDVLPRRPGRHGRTRFLLITRSR